MKKSYIKPALIVHGNVEKITLASGVANRDNPNGNNNTAFPNA